MPGSWIMQPHTPMRRAGLRLRTSLSQVTFPRALRSALSRTQHVLNSTKSALSRSGASLMPISRNMPASVSLS